MRHVRHAAGRRLLIGTLGMLLLAACGEEQRPQVRIPAPTLTAMVANRQDRGTATTVAQTEVPRQTATAYADQQLSSAEAQRAQTGNSAPPPPTVRLFIEDFTTLRYPQQGITLAKDPTWQSYQLPPLPFGLLLAPTSDASVGLMVISGIETGAELDLTKAVGYVAQFLAKPGADPQLNLTGNATEAQGTIVMTRLVGGYDVEVKGWVLARSSGKAARVAIAFVPSGSYDANAVVLSQLTGGVIFP